MSVRSSVYEKRIALTNSFQASQSRSQLWVYENKILVQNCLQKHYSRDLIQLFGRCFKSLFQITCLFRLIFFKFNFLNEQETRNMLIFWKKKRIVIGLQYKTSCFNLKQTFWQNYCHWTSWYVIINFLSIHTWNKGKKEL